LEDDGTGVLIWTAEFVKGRFAHEWNVGVVVSKLTGQRGKRKRLHSPAIGEKEGRETKSRGWFHGAGAEMIAGGKHPKKFAEASPKTDPGVFGEAVYFGRKGEGRPDEIPGIAFKDRPHRTRL